MDNKRRKMREEKQKEETTVLGRAQQEWGESARKGHESLR